MTMTCFQGHNDVGKVNVKVVFSDFKLVQIKFCIWTRLCTWHFHSICFYSRELKRHTENLTPYLFLRHCSGEICMMITCAEFCSDIYIYMYIYTHQLVFMIPITSFPGHVQSIRGKLCFHILNWVI